MQYFRLKSVLKIFQKEIELLAAAGPNVSFLMPNKRIKYTNHRRSFVIKCSFIIFFYSMLNVFVLLHVNNKKCAITIS